MRRKNAAVVMATQQMSDLSDSPIADVVPEKLCHQDPAAECGIEESQIPRILYSGRPQRA
jgi:hypothetical protein